MSLSALTEKFGISSEIQRVNSAIEGARSVEYEMISKDAFGVHTAHAHQSAQLFGRTKDRRAV